MGSAEFLWRFHCLGMIVKEIPEGLSTQTLALSVQQTFLQGIEQDPFLIRTIASYSVGLDHSPEGLCIESYDTLLYKKVENNSFLESGK